MLYQIVNGTVSAGGETILSHIDFEIKGREKIAVVGRNGAGKTTLLRLIAGELEPERDDKQKQKSITTSREITIGMLHQTPEYELEKTVEELLLEACPQKDTFSKERFAYEVEYDRIFTGFGFDKTEKLKKFSAFSGGEQTKISLIRLLLMKPDILLLDEPTNHLDIPTVEWLESYMQEYEKAVVFVSHDRFFLDQVVDVVYELQDGRLKRYPGNYTAYRIQKQKEITQQTKAYERQQAELKRLNELIEKFKNKPKKASFARSRKTLMDRMEKIPKPMPDDVHIFLNPIEPQFLGSKWVFEAAHLKVGYDKALLELSLRIKRGQKIGIIGDNGVGKSTFLKTVVGELQPVDGKCELGNHILLGYFDQNTAAVQSEKQVVTHFHDLFPSMTEKEVRQTLGSYLFSGKEASKKVDSLSGGEKSRLILAELLTSGPNFLVLDEPTNHMDIQAKETLESAFRSYSGSILFVSHDRYFINQVADAILVFQDQSVMYYPFGYAHYLKRSRQGTGEKLTAMIRAEEQAMIADFKAVPKAERHRLREIGTEEGYIDWKFQLVKKPMKEAEETFAHYRRQLDDIETELKFVRWGYHLEAENENPCKESVPVQSPADREYQLLQESSILQEQIEEARAIWTKWCMDWFDLYMETISDQELLTDK